MLTKTSECLAVNKKGPWGWCPSRIREQAVLESLRFELKLSPGLTSAKRLGIKLTRVEKLIIFLQNKTILKT